MREGFRTNLVTKNKIIIGFIELILDGNINRAMEKTSNS